MKKLVSIMCAALLLFVCTAPALAAEDGSFSPSATGKTAPVAEQSDVHVYDGADQPVQDVTVVTVTSYAEISVAGSTADTDVIVGLRKAYNEIKDAQTPAGLGVKQDFAAVLAARLNEDSKMYPADASVDDFVVSQLFDVKLDEASMTKLNGASENYVKIVFHLGISAASKPAPIVLHRNSAGKWEVIPDEDVSLDKTNGDLTVTLHSCSPFAFVEFSEQRYNNPTPTFEFDWRIIAAVVVAVLLVILIIALIAGGKKNKPEDSSSCIRVHYNRSFTARLSQSEDATKKFYSDVKNVLLSYGATSEVQWTGESFSACGAECARLNVVGGAATLYLALDPSQLKAKKFNFTDASNDPRFASLPTVVTVDNKKNMASAEALIAKMAAQFGLKQNRAYKAADFRPKTESLSTLIDYGYVKQI